MVKIMVVVEMVEGGVTGGRVGVTGGKGRWK